jgi:hypothetical protein
MTTVLEPEQSQASLEQNESVNVSTVAEHEIEDGKESSKPTSFLETQDPGHPPKPTIDAKSGMVMGDRDVSPATDFPGSQPPQPFHPTAEESRRAPRFGMPTEHDNGHGAENATSMNPLEMGKPDDMDQSAERAAAWAIHVCLIFFCALIVVCVLLTLSAVHNYSFVTLVLLTFVLLFCAFLACFVDSTILSQNPKLRPVRQKILTAVKVTRKLIEDEYRLFLRDWKESLMITEHGENCTAAENLMGDDETNAAPKRKKSKVFKLIKPFLGLKKKIRKGRRQKATNGAVEGSAATDENASPSDPTAAYQAPAI